MAKNSAWFEVFEEGQTINQNIKTAVASLGDNPKKATKLFWFYWLQFCIALFILLVCIVAPFLLFKLI